MNELSNGSATKSQLSNATGYAQSTLREHYLRPLKKQGWVKKSGNKYRLSEDIA